MEENLVKSVDALKGSKNPIYGKMFSKKEVVENWISEERLFRSWVSRDSKISDNSFSLLSNKSLDKTDNLQDVIADCLCSRFDLQDKALFKKKLGQAVSGNGNEWMKIITLHSSSLLALLCFYNVSADNPLLLDGCRFTESFFEVKTPVKNNSYSNMDVVLKGEKSGRKVLLFLESKFCEYLQSGKCDGIKANVYGDAYSKLGLLNYAQQKIKPLEFVMTDGIITISSSERYCYCNGVKQMLSHYIGISNFVRGNHGKLQNGQFRRDPDEDVLFGEIIYKLPGYVDTKGRFEKYRDLYRQLAGVINSNEETRFRMFEDIFTYQDIFMNNGFIKDQLVRDFYDLK